MDPPLRLPLNSVALRLRLLSRPVPLYTYLSRTLYAFPAFSAPSRNALRTRLPRSTSYNLSMPGSRPVSDAIRRSAVLLHSRGITQPRPSTGTPSRCTGDLIAFFEDKSYSSGTSSLPYSLPP